MSTINIKNITANMGTEKTLFGETTTLSFATLDERNAAGKIFSAAGHPLHHSGSSYSAWTLTGKPEKVTAALEAIAE